VWEVVSDGLDHINVGQVEMPSRAYVSAFGFKGPDQQKPAGVLSGGERNRLNLALTLKVGGNVLLLDEPTNDLDVETLGALEDLLDGFAGTLVVVSHDRYFLERVCDRVVGLLGDGRLVDLPGGVDDYLRMREAALASAGSAGDARLPSSGPSSSAEARAARKELARIERQLEKLATRAAQLHAELAAQATDHEAVQRLDAQLRAVDAETAALEDDWLRAADLSG
jgi:ABC-type multidrug transport system ATPase subunit